VSNRSLASLTQGLPNYHNGFGGTTFAFDETEADSPISAPQGSAPVPVLDEADLRDYLIGWNRYCPNLRCMQVNKEVLWERRFVGDKWVERVVAVAVTDSE